MAGHAASARRAAERVVAALLVVAACSLSFALANDGYTVQPAGDITVIQKEQEVLQARVQRNLLAAQPAAAACTFCITIRRASGVSAQDCPNIAGRLLPGLSSYFPYQGFTCQVASSTSVTVCTSTAGPHDAVQQYLSDLNGSFDIKMLLKDLGLVCLTPQTADYMQLWSPCLAQNTQVKMSPTSCNATNVPPPPPREVGSSSCRVCASVFRAAGGFSSVACNQLAALLSLPVLVGNSNPTVPSGQALPFACYFVSTSSSYTPNSAPGFPSYGLPPTVGSNTGTIMTACADFGTPNSADMYLSNLQTAGGPAGLADMLGLTCSITHIDALSATSTCSGNVVSLQPSTCSLTDPSPPPSPRPPSPKPPSPRPPPPCPSPAPPPSPPPGSPPPWFFNSPPPPWWQPSPPPAPPSPAVPTCRVCVAMTRPHDFVNADGCQQLVNVMNAATLLFYLPVKMSQQFQCAGSDQARAVACAVAMTQQDAQLILQQLSPAYDPTYASRVQSALGLACGQYRLPNGVMSYEGLEAASECNLPTWSAIPPSFCPGS